MGPGAYAWAQHQAHRKTRSGPDFSLCLADCVFTTPQVVDKVPASR